ncbi:MAG: pentapeptide repeat-containing protein, partial [Dolichospermum sp.]
TRANLSGVNLTEANLRGARLHYTKFYGANLHGAYYDESTKFPRDFDPLSHNMQKL